MPGGGHTVGNQETSLSMRILRGGLVELEETMTARFRVWIFGSQLRRQRVASTGHVMRDLHRLPISQFSYSHASIQSG